MHSKPWIMVLSWEDSIIISRDNPIIKPLSKFDSKGRSHQSPFFPRFSPIIFFAENSLVQTIFRIAKIFLLCNSITTPQKCI